MNYLSAYLLCMASTATTLATLLQKLGKDPYNQGAWDIIATDCGPEMLRLAKGILGDATSAEDAVQDAFLYLRDHAETFRGTTQQSALAWVRQLTRSAALQMLRAQKLAKRHAPALAHHHLAQQTLNTEALSAEPQNIGDIRTALTELPRNQQQSLVMRFLEGREYDDVAKDLGCSTAMARTHVHRGLKNLRKRLALAGLPLALSAISGQLSASISDLTPTQHPNMDPLCDPTHSASSELVSLMSQSANYSSKLSMAAAVFVIATVAIGSFLFLSPPQKNNESREPAAQEHAAQHREVHEEEPVTIAEATPAKAMDFGPLVANPLPNNQPQEEEPTEQREDKPPESKVEPPQQTRKPSMRFQTMEHDVSFYTNTDGDTVQVVSRGTNEMTYDGPLEEEGLAQALGSDAAKWIIGQYNGVYSAMKEAAKEGGTIEEITQKSQETLERFMLNAARKQERQDPPKQNQENF